MESPFCVFKSADADSWLPTLWFSPVADVASPSRLFPSSGFGTDRVCFAAIGWGTGFGVGDDGAVVFEIDFG
jgi:hypothetical protein